MTVFNPSAALSGSPNVIFIPSPLRVCGNCNFWIGTRFRHGLLGYAALRGAAGKCCNRTRHVEVPEECACDATPMASPDCPMWENGLGGPLSPKEEGAR